MVRLLDSVVVVGWVDAKGRPLKVSAMGTAFYCRHENIVTVKLSVTLWDTSFSRILLDTNISWLPEARVVRKSVPANRASELARKIIDRWTDTVRVSLPEEGTPRW